MEVWRPQTLEEALALRAAHPEAVPIAGGTDLMVELNFNRRRPGGLIDVSRLPELKHRSVENGTVFLGAGLTYTQIIAEFRHATPLVYASRTVGSPQIRNRGTIGGNLGTASPAGDALPVLAAYDASVVVASRRGGTREVPWDHFLVGPKKSSLEPDALILGTRWRAVRGPGSFSKVGPRNAMVIAVASLCLVVAEEDRGIRVALGSVGPTVLRAREAEALAAQAMTRAGTWDDPAAPVPTGTMEEFGERVAASARPIDDVRGTAEYRRHACAVLARRALAWALEDRRTP
jgi:CO/xanthine dehydrogenase FAD-binding subunit